MFQFFILRDLRLEGSLPTAQGTLISTHVDGSTPLSNAFARINTAARNHGKLKTLFILCHGMGTGYGNTSDFWWRGGTGLRLGQENLTAANVSAWTSIKNSVENIVVYACGAAYSGVSSITSTTQNDGQSLMTELAKNTNAIVYAADQIQWYFPANYNFGRWEGIVYRFYPSGVKIMGLLPPTEITEII